MNKEKALELLKNYLDEYGDGFVFHSSFICEFKEILLKNAQGAEKEVFNLLVKQLSFVNALGIRVDCADGNEKLKGMKSEQEYYSLHIKNKTVNIRLLMTFKNEVPMFLAAFNEKEGKKTTDYSQWERVIKERSKQIRGDSCEE